MTHRLAGLLVALIAVGVASAHADPVADFYKGRTVSLIVSTSVGGGYDALGRAVARFLGRHVPGNPAVIVRNMAGAGGIVATNFIFNQAERDGTTIGLLQDNAPFKPLLGTSEARYDATAFNWLGSPSADTGMLVAWGGSPIRSLDAARTREMTVGAAAVNSTPALYARLLNEVLGLHLKVIVGYPGQTEAFLAMEHGEIDGYPSVFYSTLQATKPDWLPQGRIRALLYYGPDRHPELGGVAYAADLVTDENDRRIAARCGFRAAHHRQAVRARAGRAAGARGRNAHGSGRDLCGSGFRSRKRAAAPRRRRATRRCRDQRGDPAHLCGSAARARTAAAPERRPLIARSGCASTPDVV